MLKSSYLFSRVSRRGRTLCSLTWRGCWRPPRTWLATWNLPLPVWSNQRADCCRAGSSSSAGLWQGSWVSCRYDFMNEWMNEWRSVCVWLSDVRLELWLRAASWKHSWSKDGVEMWMYWFYCNLLLLDCLWNHLQVRADLLSALQKWFYSQYHNICVVHKENSQIHVCSSSYF